jgi:hypothetical protein
VVGVGGVVVVGLLDVEPTKSRELGQELFAFGHKSTKSGKQEEAPSPNEAGSVCVCGRSSCFIEPGCNECACAKV